MFASETSIMENLLSAAPGCHPHGAQRANGLADEQALAQGLADAQLSIFMPWSSRPRDCNADGSVPDFDVGQVGTASGSPGLASAMRVWR